MVHSSGPSAACPRLVLGLMPPGATPNSFRPSGPWCFAGQEEFFPDWEDRFLFPPEPLCRADEAAQAAEEAQALCADMIPRVAAQLCPHWADLPESYWETLLAPWAIVVSSQIVERQKRVQALCAAWGDSPLAVELLPENCRFVFGSDQDVVLHGALGTEFNHWLFSRLLEAQWPAAWRRITLPELERHFSREEDAPQTGWRAALKQRLRELLLRLPFPRLKGMSLAQALGFSLALSGECAGEDRGRSLREAFGSEATGRVCALPLDPLPLFMAALPESLRRMEHPPTIFPPPGKRHLRVASVAAYEDAEYRRFLAVWRAQGHRLAYVQHGGNYGQIATACATAMVEFSQHAFFTWGWDSYTARGLGKGEGPCWLPMPYPQLAGLKDAWQGGSGRLILVGTEMPLYAYRLDARPTPLQMVQYREDKQWFLEALPRSVQDVTYYRPYFDVPGSLEDAPWLLPRFPHVHLCTGPLEEHMLSCRLLVLDHNCTTLLQALAANVPTIAFWTRDVWPQTPEAGAWLDALAEVGIWQPTAESAAAKVYEVWDDPLVWWRSEAVQRVRRDFCRCHARTTDGSPAHLWILTLKRLMK